MKPEDLKFLEEKALKAARQAWPQTKDYELLARRRDEALRNKRWFEYNQFAAALDAGEIKLKDKFMKDCLDAIEMVQRARENLSNEQLEKFNVHAIRSFLLMDMLENDLMEMKDLTICFKTGSYNPICPELLEDLLAEVRGQLGFVYKDSEREVIREFVKGADHLDKLMTDNARSLIKKIDNRLKEAS